MHERLAKAYHSYDATHPTIADFYATAPEYNVGKLLSAALDAAQKQEYARMHLILDGINQAFNTTY